jgi:predicted ATPase/DNA-binding XRE family transcriptional regulator
METTISFGYWIRRQRKARDLTQQALAEQVGCSLAAIKKIEQDERRPSRQIAGLLADVLGVPAGQREIFLEVARGLRPVEQLALAQERTVSTATQLEKSFLNNLPVQLTSFIGREREIAEVIRLLEKARLVTLTGPGGTGKTRLSIQIANQVLDQYPDGAWMVELAPILDPLLIPRTLAIAIGLRDEPHRPVIDMLCDYLRPKKMLLLLDNCEHLIEACAQLADTLLHACPQIRILATSREALGISGETLYLVPSLTRPDIRNLPSLEALNQYEAIQLFLDRATSAIPSFTLTDENASSVAQICQRLDGIPLAIELAAGKIRALSVQQIAQHLDDRFHLLMGGSRTALPRHQTLQATIDWSYNLLSPAEQILFRRLSVFVGGWTLEAAKSVCLDQDIAVKDSLKAEDILELLTQLVNKSLVATKEQNGEVRYSMLETIRRYADDKLLTSGESDRVGDRHLDFFIRFAETAEPKLRSAEQMEWLDRLETERDNLRAALAWSLESRKSNHALRLAGAVYYFWSERSYSREKLKWLDEVMTLSNHERSRTVASVETRAETAWRAKVLFAAGQARVVTFLDPTTSRRMVEESLHLWRELGNKWWMAVALEHIAFMLTMEGDHETAQARAEEGVSLARDVEGHWPLAVCLIRLVSPLMRTGDPTAHQVAEEGVAVARRVGDKSVLSFGLIMLASTYLMEGNFMGAAPVVEEALAQARLIRNVSYITLSLLLLIFITCLLGDLANVKDYCLELLALARETGAPFLAGYVLLAFGLVASFEEQPSRGVRLLAACEAAYHQGGISLSVYGGPLLLIYNHALDKARAQLDPATFESAFAEAQKVSLDEALDFVSRIIAEM